MHNLRPLVIEPSFWDAFPDVLSVKDLAAITRKADITMWRWLNSGVIPAHRVGTAWICYKSEVRDWFNEPNKQHTTVPMPEDFLAKYPNVLSVAELAELLGKTRQTTYEWLKAGVLPGQQIAGQWRVFKNEITDLLRESSNVTTV